MNEAEARPTRLLAVARNAAERTAASRMGAVGCEVAFVADADSALQRIEEGGFDVVLCFSDVVRRGDALRLVSEVACKWPSVHAVIMGDAGGEARSSARTAAPRQSAYNVPR